MAPRDTNLEKEKKRHAGPLIGITVALVFAFGAFIWWIWYVFDEAEQPTPEEPAVEATE